jgi:hypothetical protein
VRPFAPKNEIPDTFSDPWVILITKFTLEIAIDHEQQLQSKLPELHQRSQLFFEFPKHQSNQAPKIFIANKYFYIQKHDIAIHLVLFQNIPIQTFFLDLRLGLSCTALEKFGK